MTGEIDVEQVYETWKNGEYITSREFAVMMGRHGGKSKIEVEETDNVLPDV